MKIKTQELRKLITLKGLTRAGLSRELGVSTTAIYKITSGRNGASPETLRKLCKVLECDPDEIVEEW